MMEVECRELAGLCADLGPFLNLGGEKYMGQRQKEKEKREGVFCHFTWDKEIYSKNRAYFPVG